MKSPDLTARLRSLLDEEQALDLLRRAIGCASVTGHEKAFARLLAGELEELGAEGVTLRDFAPGRPNVWGWRRGLGKDVRHGEGGGLNAGGRGSGAGNRDGEATRRSDETAHGGGRSLMLVGHTDTVHVEGWEKRWAGTERQDPFGGAIVDGEIWGRGAGDLKAGICAALAAVRLLDRAGIELAGDVVLAFVGDEESGEPGMGVSAGMKALVPAVEAGELPRPDFAIYVEPTRLAVYTAQMGFFIADIKITGESAYFGVPELGKDALKAAHAVLSALWEHSSELEARGSHPLIGHAFLLVTEIAGGGYIAVPGECRLSLIRKLLPGEDLDEAAAELERVARGAVTDPDIAVAFSYPAARDHRVGGTPTEVDAGHPAVAELRARIAQAVAGRAASAEAAGQIAGAPYWSEAPFLMNRLGVPTVYFAPGDIRNCHTLFERVPVDDYFSGIVALAAFMADYCGVIRDQAAPQGEEA